MSRRAPSSGAVGWITFAGFVMIISGGFSILQGLGMLINSNQFPNSDSVFSQNATTWGWVQLLVGAVVLLAGFGVFSGSVLARTVGVIGALISALASFVAIALYPVWGICIIAVDIAVIWALTAHGRDVQRMREMSETGTGQGGTFQRSRGVTHIAADWGAATEPPGDLVTCDVMRASVNPLIRRLRSAGVTEGGGITLTELEAVVSAAADCAQAEILTPQIDTIVWEEALGFPMAALAAFLLTLAARGLGQIPEAYPDGQRPVSNLLFGANLGAFVVAFVAGAAGIIALGRAKSGAVVGCWCRSPPSRPPPIPEWPWPLGNASGAGQSLLILLVNLAGLLAGGVVTLLGTRVQARRIEAGRAILRPERGL